MNDVRKKIDIVEQRLNAIQEMAEEITKGESHSNKPKVRLGNVFLIIIILSIIFIIVSIIIIKTTPPDIAT